MNLRRSLIAGTALLIVCTALHAADLQPLHSSCFISAGDHPGQFRLRLEDETCKSDRHCGNFSDQSFSRLSGITVADLGREGAQVTAELNAEAGTFSCSGTVQNAVLTGSSTFTANSEFVARMERMGFKGLDSEKLEAYTLFDIQTAWVQSLKDARIGGLTIDNLIAMRIFHIDPGYVSGFISLGYEVPDADKLIALKVQGVNAQEVREIRNLGFQPSLDELVQIRIFHITPEFIRRMQARGLNDLTIAKLVQIKIFKLDE